MQALRIVPLLLLAAAGFAQISGCSSTPAERAAGAPADDAATAARVRSALFQEARMSSVDIHVNTYRGIVQLSGFVDSQEAAQRAADVALRVRGVSRIENALLVKPKN